VASSGLYWPSSTYEGLPTHAWITSIDVGTVSSHGTKTFNLQVWPVRGGAR